MKLERLLILRILWNFYRLKNRGRSKVGRATLGPFYFDELSNLGPLKYNINEMTVEEIDD